tara:strand:- start:128 stop:1009 length:882 start_codon:yes stop_codon:yes gene_type:complete
MAPVVLMLAGVIVRATTKKTLQRLMNAGFRKASSGVAKSKANIVNATDDNIISLITRAKARSKTRGKGTTDKPKPKTQAEVKEALKRNENKVSSKKFGDRKLSDYDKVGSNSNKKGNLKGNLIIAALTALSPSSTKDTSVASAPLTKYEKDKIRKTPGRKAPEKKTTSPKQPEFPRLGPKSEKKSNVNIPTKKQIFTAQAGATKPKTPALEAGFSVDKSPPASVIKKVAPMLRPKARPETVKKAKKQLSAFGKAFKAARAAKKYSFPYQGKEITTRYKEETVAEHRKKFPKKK